MNDILCKLQVIITQDQVHNMTHSTIPDSGVQEVKYQSTYIALAVTSIPPVSTSSVGYNSANSALSRTYFKIDQKLNIVNTTSTPLMTLKQTYPHHDLRVEYCEVLTEVLMSEHQDLNKIKH